MSKTTEVQIEKSRNLIEGLRRHVREMGERQRVGDGTSGMRGACRANTQGEEDERPDDNRQGLLRRIEEDPEGLLSAGTLARLRNSR